MAEKFKGPVVNSSRGIEIVAQTGCRVCPVSRPGRLMLASQTTARAAVPSEGRRHDTFTVKLTVLAQVVQVTDLFLCTRHVTVMDQLKNLIVSYW